MRLFFGFSFLTFLYFELRYRMRAQIHAFWEGFPASIHLHLYSNFFWEECFHFYHGLADKTYLENGKRFYKTVKRFEQSTKIIPRIVLKMIEKYPGHCF